MYKPVEVLVVEIQFVAGTLVVTLVMTVHEGFGVLTVTLTIVLISLSESVETVVDEPVFNTQSVAGTVVVTLVVIVHVVAGILTVTLTTDVTT